MSCWLAGLFSQIINIAELYIGVMIFLGEGWLRMRGRNLMSLFTVCLHM